MVTSPLRMEARATESATALPEHYFELYKLAVEMSDRLSARRGLANSFFLTVHTGLAAIVGGRMFGWQVPAAGIVLAVTWWALLRSYRDLNAAKFEVIVRMETRLAVAVFGDERAHYAARRGRFRRYRELGKVERVVPWVFAVVYVAELVRQVVS